MKRSRARIAMSRKEIALLLDEVTSATLTTLGRDHWPHSTAMWFVPDLGSSRILMWTYAKSQKAKNAARDPRAAFLVETGESYDELRGVLVRSPLRIESEFDFVLDVGKRIFDRYVTRPAGLEPTPEVLADIERQAHKRIALVLPLERVASWDHRKLGAGSSGYSAGP